MSATGLSGASWLKASMGCLRRAGRHVSRAGWAGRTMSPEGGRWFISQGMTRFALQFGLTQPGLTYLERISCYGICPRGEANIAIVQIGKKAPYEYDLPGGGV